MKLRHYRLSQIEMGEFSLVGYSVAGEESVVIVPELDCCFDIGKCPREALNINNVLLTHGHADHVAGLLYYFAQRDFQGIAGGTAVVHESLVEPLEDLIAAWGRVEGHVPPHRIVGVKVGQDYEIRKGLVARAFPVSHVGNSLGFAIIETRNKLKPEFAGLSGPEIVALKDKGVEISGKMEIPLVACLGDTGPADYASLPYVANAKALLIECTFFDEDHATRAKAGKHLHANDLPGILSGMNNEKIVIIHITRRTNMAAARKILREKLPAEILDRVTFLMSAKHIEED